MNEGVFLLEGSEQSCPLSCPKALCWKFDSKKTSNLKGSINNSTASILPPSVGQQRDETWDVLCILHFISYIVDFVQVKK